MEVEALIADTVPTCIRLVLDTNKINVLQEIIKKRHSRICIFIEMDEERIKEIVSKIFSKAQSKSVARTKSALSNHIANEITEKHSYIHSRTLERAYDRYLNENKKYGPPQAESINLFCKYLGYENFSDYSERNKLFNATTEKDDSGWARKIMMIVLVTFVLIYLFQIKSASKKTGGDEKEQCMTWADSLYLKVSCSKTPLSNYGTKVEPLDQVRFESFKLVKVSQAYPFFNENGEPMIWYYKNENKEYEFFTAPGLHPVTNETLKKITPYIIQNYVPLHSYKPQSFMKE